MTLRGFHRPFLSSWEITSVEAVVGLQQVRGRRSRPTGGEWERPEDSYRLVREEWNGFWVKWGCGQIYEIKERTTFSPLTQIWVSPYVVSMFWWKEGEFTDVINFQTSGPSTIPRSSSLKEKTRGSRLSTFLSFPSSPSCRFPERTEDQWTGVV